MSTRIADSWFLTGPTAAGKSAVSVELARRIGAEIVSMDSMALYRGMDIGTAKPTPAERESVPHHLIDAIEPCDEFSLAQYIEAAEREAAEIAVRGRQVLFVGGTPLYLKGLRPGGRRRRTGNAEQALQIDEHTADEEHLPAADGNLRRFSFGRLDLTGSCELVARLDRFVDQVMQNLIALRRRG